MEYNIHQINKEPDVEQRTTRKDRTAVRLYRLRVHAPSALSVHHGGARDGEAP